MIGQLAQGRSTVRPGLRRRRLGATVDAVAAGAQLGRYPLPSFNPGMLVPNHSTGQPANSSLEGSARQVRELC